MATFDSWEVAVRPPEDYLMHFRTKGSKNGVRRYQTESGEWTELGLEERRKREGFGESRAERRAQKRIERAERHQARKEARAQRKAERAERKRKSSIKGLTDEEMKAKLERAKMEAEYRDLTKRGTLIESGANLISRYLDYREKKEQRDIERNKQIIDMERIKADKIKAQERTKTAKSEAKKAVADAKKAKSEAKEKESELKIRKIDHKETTIRGGISKRINLKLTSGWKEKYAAKRKAEGEVNANRIKSDGARDLKNRKASQKEKDKTPEFKAQERRTKQLEKERKKSQQQYEKELKKHVLQYNKGSFKKYK